MKALLPLLSTCLVSVPSANSLAKSQNVYQAKNSSYEKDDLEISNFSESNFLFKTINLIQTDETLTTFVSQWIENIELFLKNDSRKSEILKNDFLNSLYLNNGKVGIDLEKMSEYKNYSFYSMLSALEFEKMWNYSLAIGFLNYENNIFTVREKTSNYIEGVWTEGHWYWGIYWRVHFSHEKVLELKASFEIVRDVSGAMGAILSVIPGWTAAIGKGAAVLGIFLWSQFDRLEAYDYGNGAWFGVFGIVPFAGFGSH